MKIEITITKAIPTKLKKTFATKKFKKKLFNEIFFH